MAQISEEQQEHFEGVKAAWEWMTENASDKVSERPLTPGRINF